MTEGEGPTLPLPEADDGTSAEVKDWLARFAACVREVDYAAAYPFWHEGIAIFGTYQELVRSRRAWTETQWDNVWPRTADFAFDLANTLVLASPDGAMAVAVAPWTSTGFHPDGTSVRGRPWQPDRANPPVQPWIIRSNDCGGGAVGPRRFGASAGAVIGW